MKKNTKEFIVKTTLKLFMKYGVENTSMNMLAMECGISKPAIYYYFKSKKELAKGVLNYFEKEMNNWSRKHHNKNDNAKTFFKKLITSIQLFKDVATMVLLEKVPEEINYSFNEIMLQISKISSESKEKSKSIGRMTRHAIGERIKIAQLTGEIRNDLNPETIGILIHAIIEGMEFIGSLDSDLDLNKISEAIFEDFWKMITK